MIIKYIIQTANKDSDEWSIYDETPDSYQEAVQTLEFYKQTEEFHNQKFRILERKYIIEDIVLEYDK